MYFCIWAWQKCVGQVMCWEEGLRSTIEINASNLAQKTVHDK